MIELTPILDSKSHTPLYMQLANYMKKEIISGNIKPNEKMPSKRKLSQYLHLSLNTVQAAYDQLCAEGYLESKPRQGLYVKVFEEGIITTPISPPIPEMNSRPQPTIKVDFNSGKLDLEHFPYAIWRKLTIQSLYEDQCELFSIGHPQGEPSLRMEIAKYLFESRGVRCVSEQILIGAGTQVLIGLLSLIIGKEPTYALEDPGFHRTRIILQDSGVNTIPIPLNEEGIDVKFLKNSRGKIVYVTPSHQFPYGMVMPIQQRFELLKWAEEKDGYIIEDDYDGEYRYSGKPIPSLQGLDHHGCVVYLGSFSKSLIPSLRISYMVLPPNLLKRYQEQLSLYKQTASRLHQDTLFRFMTEGHWQSHLNKMRTLYRKKHATLITAIKNELGDNVNVIGEKSGLHIILDVKNGMLENELIRVALQAGVKIYPLSVYYHDLKDSLESKVLLGFGGLSESEIVEGIRLLKEAWQL